MTLSSNSKYGGLHFSQKETSELGIEILHEGSLVTWKLKMTRSDGSNSQLDSETKAIEVEWIGS